MRTAIGLAIFLGVGAGAVGAGALETMKGSDTLFDITTDVIANCKVNGTSVGISYIGTGSGAGETALVNVASPVQHVAPMSRFFQKGSASNTI